MLNGNISPWFHRRKLLMTCILLDRSIIYISIIYFIYILYYIYIMYIIYILYIVYIYINIYFYIYIYINIYHAFREIYLIWKGGSSLGELLTKIKHKVNDKFFPDVKFTLTPFFFRTCSASSVQVNTWEQLSYIWFL